jgi:hypothetical protein
MFKKSPAAKKAAAAAAAKKTFAKSFSKVPGKPAAKKAPAAAKSTRPRSNARVLFAQVGGYAVFGSPVRPAHRSAEEIAQAVSELG